VEARHLSKKKKLRQQISSKIYIAMSLCTVVNMTFCVVARCPKIARYCASVRSQSYPRLLISLVYKMTDCNNNRQAIANSLTHSSPYIEYLLISPSQKNFAKL